MNKDERIEELEADIGLMEWMLDIAIRKLQGYEYKGMHITDVQEKLQELAYKEESEGKKPYLVLVKE